MSSADECILTVKKDRAFLSMLINSFAASNIQYMIMKKDEFDPKIISKRNMICIEGSDMLILPVAKHNVLTALVNEISKNINVTSETIQKELHDLGYMLSTPADIFLASSTVVYKNNKVYTTRVVYLLSKGVLIRIEYILYNDILKIESVGAKKKLSTISPF